MIAAVKIRGSIDAREKVQHTLETLGLRKKFQVRVMEDNDSNQGMLRQAKDYIAYGKIDDETAAEIGEKGETVSLSPPSGGFKSTKKQYHQGGSLGKRGDMEELLERML